jgi:outer membrane beta-barrel protein
MRRNFQKLGWIVLMTAIMILLQNIEARATETLEIQEDELAQESVLPKFDRPDSVLRRNVTTEKKFELGGYYGWDILEPIENQSKVGVNGGYHFSESSALMLNYAQWLPGLNTQYTDGLSSSNNLDFSRAPKLKYSLYAHYEWKVFYGKISFTKQSVVNLSTYPIFGIGTTAYENKSYYGVDAGIGQKFYFGKSFALRADLKLQYSGKPSPFLQGSMKAPTDTTPGDPQPTPDQFKDKWDFGTILDIGVSFLL